jgi:hypothetical protein
VDEKSLAPRAPYVLYRVRPYGTEELVSEHPDFECGWKAGVDAVTVEDNENAYLLSTAADAAWRGSGTAG